MTKRGKGSALPTGPTREEVSVSKYFREHVARFLERRGILDGIVEACSLAEKAGKSSAAIGAAHEWALRCKQALGGGG